MASVILLSLGFLQLGNMRIFSFPRTCLDLSLLLQVEVQGIDMEVGLDMSLLGFFLMSDSIAEVTLVLLKKFSGGNTGTK